MKFEIEKELTEMKLKTNAFAHRATRAAHLAHGAGLLAVVAMAWMPQTMRAQENPWVLDNFQTGGGKLQATSGSNNAVNQPGSGIIGGNRNISIVFSTGGNEFGQLSTVQVRPSAEPKVVPPALIWSNGFDAVPGFVVEYFGLNNGTPLNLNVTNYDRFRVSFEGLSTSIALTAEVWYGGSFNMYGDESCLLPASNSPFTVDIPFAGFTTDTAPIPWSSLDGLLMELTEGSSPLNSPNLAITEYSAIMATVPAGTITCGPPTT